MNSCMNKLRSRGVVVRAILLGVATLFAFLLVGPVAFSLGGWTAVAVAATAGTLCLIGAVIALVTGHLLRGPQFVMAALLTGMAARMGVPFCLGLAIHLQGGPLANANLLYYLLVFYPVTLTVGTVLSLPQNRQSAQPVSTSNPPR
jgi:hypothetical protein